MTTITVHETREQDCTYTYTTVEELPDDWFFWTLWDRAVWLSEHGALATIDRSDFMDSTIYDVVIQPQKGD